MFSYASQATFNKVLGGKTISEMSTVGCRLLLALLKLRNFFDSLVRFWMTTLKFF